MAHLSRSLASLRIAGDELIPEEISKLLGAQASHAQRKGQVLQSAQATRLARFGHWRLQAAETSPEDLDGQVAELLNQLTSDLDVWRDLASRYDIDLFCGWFMREGNEGVSISPSTLQALGERHIKLDLDIYAPEYGAEQGS
ncbi:DUF4279 domain-containing protein [Chitinimonas taiwanensis]|uniref:DUF4279 domain-containing protein n=1 Tax=Chitinimonas taiwanensis TaxID=240412 RepID=UPI0035AF7481